MNNKNTLKKSQTDWARIDAMTDEDIDLSDCPEITDEMWSRGVLQKGFQPVKNKNQENFPIDRDILDFFKKQGKGYQTKINQLLRTYMEEVQKQI